jgi:uncharacterized protein (TIGR02099 family)
MSKRKGERDIRRIVLQHYLNIGRLCVRHSRDLLKKCWMGLALFVITLALIFSIFRALTPLATQYKSEVERHLTTLIGQPVSINSMETSWYWFEPVLKLNQVTLSDARDHVLKLDKLLVGINVISSLWHWHIQPGILYIDDVHVSLHQMDDHWQVDGLLQNQQVTTINAEAYIPTLVWLLRQQKIVLKNISALVHFKDGTLLPLSAINLTAVNHNGRFRFRGNAKLAQTTPTTVDIRADLTLNPYALEKASGHVYLSVKDLLFTQWQRMMPKFEYQLEGGKGDFEVWLDMVKGSIASVQSKIDVRRVAILKATKLDRKYIQRLSLNMAIKPERGGWQVSGDKLQVRLDGFEWPENAFKISFDASKQRYDCFIESLVLEPLLALGIAWPEKLSAILALHPHGRLQSTQFVVIQGELSSFLTNFRELGFETSPKGFGARNLAGVLSWKPDSGRVKLDSDNVMILSRTRSDVQFSKINASFSWSNKGPLLDLQMDHFLLRRFDDELYATGSLGDVLSPINRRLSLDLRLRSHHAEQWLAYIPSNPHLKVKLEDWLKKDIKRVDQAEVQVNVEGRLADFPFDNGLGKFSVISHLMGTDLYFHKEWPLCGDIDAYLRVDKRELSANILHANLQGLDVHEVNLRVPGLGHDHETLLIHGKGQFPARVVKAYVLHSPLKKQLTQLQALTVSGLLGLELRLEAPLYPENDEILARGTVFFDHNQATFRHDLNDLKISNLSGTLQFDEHGVIDSEIKAHLLGNPVNIRIFKEEHPTPMTKINFYGHTTMELLQSKLKLNGLTFAEGPLDFGGALTFADGRKTSDHLKLSSSLKEVQIKLPKPFGKIVGERASLKLDMDFNKQQGIRLHINYDQRVSSDLWFKEVNDTFVLDKGEVRIGKSQADATHGVGLRVVGVLNEFDLHEWQGVMKPAGSDDVSILEAVQSFDLKIDQLKLFSNTYQKVGIQGNHLGVDNWSFRVTQKDVLGDLRYHPKVHSLSGHLNYLYLSKSLLTNSSNTLKPIDIPQLNLSIDDFKYGETDLGKVAIKSESSNTLWRLDYCNVTSAGYEALIKGEWSLISGTNATKLQGEIKILDLANALERFHITPAVEAHKGLIQFNGGWTSSLTDFSYAFANGKMYVQLQDGRITHLSPETEEKLGLGKLLSILSLQTIPRRLKLDFSDLSGGGYSFDEFKGNFTLKKGVLNTADSYVDGPVAYASMQGDLDVVKQLYDVDLHISPHITASLPIVATIAGGPIAGLATWAASKIINQGMQQVTGYTYSITGPWRDPKVDQVSIFKKTMVRPPVKVQ